MAAGAGEVHVDFSVEELAALLARIGLRGIPGVEVPTLSPEVLAVVTRGLVARGVLHEGPEADVLDAVREVLLLLGRPSVLAAAAAPAAVVWAGDDEVVVRLLERASGVWRATPLPTAELRSELPALLPSAGEEVVGPAFTVAAAAHASAVALAPTDPAAAVLHLRAAGLDEAAATAYVAAAAGASPGGVALVRRGGGEVRGGVVGWSDAGRRGLFWAPPPDGLPDVVDDVGDGKGVDEHRGSVAVEVAPTSAAALREAVAALVVEVLGPPAG